MVRKFTRYSLDIKSEFLGFMFSTVSLKWKLLVNMSLSVNLNQCYYSLEINCVLILGGMLKCCAYSDIKLRFIF